MLKYRGWFYILLIFSAGIIGGIISSFIFDSINNKSFLSTLDNASNFLVSRVFSDTGFNINLKPWWVFTFLGITILIPVVFYLINKRTIPSELAAYTEDQFKNWYWRWEWGWNSVINQWEVKKLTPFCPDCDVQLLDKSSSSASMAACSQCRRNFDRQLGEYDEAKEIEYIIHKRLREKKN